MKIIFLLSIFLIVVVKLSFSQILKDTVVDIDGNVYHTVKIENQVWFVENLKTTKYRDGTEIPNVSDKAKWSSLETAAYCNYYNKETNIKSSGRLYNWFVVNESKGICPDGWHVPTNAEWNILTDNLNSHITAKEFAGWWSYQFNGQDYLPLDYRSKDGNFLNEDSLIKTNYGGWWTSSPQSKTNALRCYVGFGSYMMVINQYSKKGGYSILCIHD